MANHISALKRVRQTKKRTVRNRVRKTRVRHQMRELRQALKAQDATKASAVLPETIRLIDRAAQKGVLTKNTAARYKSRLSLRLNALQAAAPAA
jgi:small subunit ribosomal protein S20